MHSQSGTEGHPDRQVAPPVLPSPSSFQVEEDVLGSKILDVDMRTVAPVMRL